MLKTDTMEIVHDRNKDLARARRRAARVRAQRIDRLLTILYRFVVIAAVLLVMAGAGVIDAGRTVLAEFNGALMMLGGFAVIVIAAMMWEEDK